MRHTDKGFQFRWAFNTNQGQKFGPWVDANTSPSWSVSDLDFDVEGAKVCAQAKQGSRIINGKQFYYTREDHLQYIGIASLMSIGRQVTRIVGMSLKRNGVYLINFDFDDFARRQEWQ